MNITINDDETVRTIRLALTGDVEPVKHWYGSRLFRPSYAKLVLTDNKVTGFKIGGPVITKSGASHASQTGEWHPGYGPLRPGDSWPAVAREVWRYALDQELI